MPKEVIMPALGIAQETGVLVEWFKATGEEVQKGEPLMLVATDKTEVEIEANASGTLANVTAQPGDEIPVGHAIALILAPGESAPAVTSAASPATSSMVSTQPATAVPNAVSDQPLLPVSPLAARIAAEHGIVLSQVPAKGDRIHKEDVLAYLNTQNQTASTNGRVLASPKARRLAQEHELNLAEIAGSGPDGAVLAADVEKAVLSPAFEASSESPASDPLPMSRLWRVMAQRLQESWATVPHFYLEREVNASALMAWHERLMSRIEQKVTITDLLVKLVAAALSNHPRLNASWLDESIVPNDEINIGLAVAVEDGLLVPVIHQTNQLGVGAIASRRADLVNNALEGKLMPQELSGGTFTISNLGMFGITKFNAIVNPPQAAILAVGAITDRIVPVNGQPAVQPIMTLTLSCDHRVVDGARGAQFMQTLVTYLEDPLTLLSGKGLSDKGQTERGGKKNPP
ncbi:2-oxo acid dehydrogenase subunit E2 [Chloroflexi bacterium TSY]|nr:2-oxo acid dehydrogenase subunit E2 [Chloroflexi bacterium TSY]